jgi:hypothetical protein
MMLEYLLVRPADRDALFANHRCRFVVLDEVHTYRGSLGANIALLLRRLLAASAHARQDWSAETASDRSLPRALTWSRPPRRSRASTRPGTLRGDPRGSATRREPRAKGRGPVDPERPAGPQADVARSPGRASPCRGAGARPRLADRRASGAARGADHRCLPPRRHARRAEAPHPPLPARRLALHALRRPGLRQALPDGRGAVRLRPIDGAALPVPLLRRRHPALPRGR